MVPKTNSVTYFIVKPERSDFLFNNIVTSGLWFIVFTKIKSSDLRNNVFLFISAI